MMQKMFVPLRALVCTFFLTTIAAPAPAQAIYAENRVPARGVEIEYELTIRNPVQHLYHVEIGIRGVRSAYVDLSMPAWAPGAYTIRNFAKDVQDFRAATSRNQPLKWEQTDKQTWRVTKQQNDDVKVQYQVFSLQLTDEMADLSGPAVFMFVVGQKHVPVSVKYNVPNNWKVYTGLEKKGDRYHATDYDIFIDAPAFIGGSLKVLGFEVDKLKHRLVFSKPDVAMIDEQVISDIQDVIDAARSIFGGKLPYRDYTFLFKVQSNSGSGGVEHLNSTRITVGENDFVNQTSYQRFLSVVAHEFFHLWSGKRIRPQVLGPFDYTKEVNTKLLWVFEGITSYYADLLLARADIYTPQDYYSKLSAEINSLQHQPGRLLMSPEEASWNTWTRSDNADNNTVSYYTKGEIVGLALDLEIRMRTKNQKSLDDVMRYLKEQYADKGIGLPEDGFFKAVETVAGSDLSEFFEANVQSRKEIDYSRYLKPAGLQINITKEPGTIYAGIEFDRTDGGQARIRRIIAGSPAERAKLDTGDILIAMNNERITFENFSARLHSHKLGETIKLTVMRGERALTLDLIPVEFQEERWSVAEASAAARDQIQLRNSWLGLKENK
jgi:predicted metalloprotease with PDZ domain